MSNDFVLDEFLPYRIAVLAGRLSREFSRVYRDRYGLDRAEWRVVAHLSQQSAVSVREIHARVDMDKSKVSRAAARLVTNGYVTKSTSAADRRLVELALTAKGRAMMRDLAPLAQAYQSRLIEALGPQAPGFVGGIAALIERGG